MNTLAALMTARFGSSTTVASDTSVNATIATLLQHRTHRAFTDQAVAAEVLQQLLAATLSAPSKSDLQQVSLIHVRAPDRIFGVGVKTDKVSFYSDPKYPQTNYLPARPLIRQYTATAVASWVMRP